MCSYDVRRRAVQLAIELCKRTGLTNRQLRYPTKNALKAWHQAFEQRHGLPRAYAREPKHTPSQRTLAVDHLVANGRFLAFAIMALGYAHAPLLRLLPLATGASQSLAWSLWPAPSRM